MRRIPWTGRASLLQREMLQCSTVGGSHENKCLCNRNKRQGVWQAPRRGWGLGKRCACSVGSLQGKGRVGQGGTG